MQKEPFEPTPPDEPEIWEALARHLAGESSPEESARVRAWLAEDTARAALIEQIDGGIHRMSQDWNADVDVEAALERVKARRFERPAGVPWRSNIVRAAAAVTLLLGGSLIWRAATNKSGPDQTVVAANQTYQTRVGETDTLELANGTSVVLGPASRLVLAAGYGENTRQAELTGVALFDVVHDANRPFSVRVGGANVRDIGTTFVVRGGAAEPVSVAVTAGSVVMHPAGEDESQGVVLKAGDRGEMAADGHVVAKRGTVGDDELAWTKGRLVFEDATIDQVAAELRRWYGIDLRVADASLTKRHITGSFQDESAEEVLNVIALALGAHIERNGDTAIVHANP